MDCIVYIGHILNVQTYKNHTWTWMKTNSGNPCTQVYLHLNRHGSVVTCSWGLDWCFVPQQPSTCHGTFWTLPSINLHNTMHVLYTCWLWKLGLLRLTKIWYPGRNCRKTHTMLSHLLSSLSFCLSDRIKKFKHIVHCMLLLSSTWNDLHLS